MKIIPAIDIINGECVRLTKGDYEAKKSYFKNPLEATKRFEDYGFTRLHVVDLEGAKSGEIKNLKTLENICSNTSLIVDFGGGVKSTSALESALAAGASFVTCGSIAVKNPSLVLSWLEKYNDKLILGADCKNRMIATFGWLETSDIDVITFIQEWKNRGFSYCISTDISKDGMLKGPSFELYEDISNSIPDINVIASGGISSLEDLLRLKNMKLSGAIVGKAYYEGYLTLEELREVEC